MKKKTAKKTAKRAAKTARVIATRKDQRVPAFAYADRIPILADELKHRPQRRASVAELFDAVKSQQFRTLRRVAATIRADGRSESPVFERVDGGYVTLRHAVRNGKPKISRKRTKRAS